MAGLAIEVWIGVNGGLGLEGEGFQVLKQGLTGKFNDFEEGKFLFEEGLALDPVEVQGAGDGGIVVGD